MLYPLVKERVVNSKIIKNIYLLKNEANTRQIDIHGDGGKFLAGYFLNEQDFGARQDSFIEVTQGKIKIYDK